jgi:hypothetical protein
MRQQAFFLLCGVGVLSACSDAPAPTAVSTGAQVVALDRGGRGHRDEKFAAIGTSITMGWTSNGVYSASQRVSWPALLGFATRNEITQPLIESPGCTSPMVAPLADGKRLSGESLSPSTVCAPNVAGITLPTQNVGIAGALAAEALMKPPEAPGASPWYARVLAPGTTQLTAALSQQPTVVSVELGGNEVLGALTGLIVPGVTVVPLPFYVGPMEAILNAVGATGAKVVVFGLPAEGRNVPALRRADEIWANRLEFAALHVDVSPDCETSPNYINVSVKSLNAAFEGAFRFANGFPNATFSCADVPGTQDLVLTPADITVLNGMLAQMTAYVRAQATARGFAYASLAALFDFPDLKPATYSVVSHLTSSRPFGLYTSLDGVHPSAAGNVLLAIDAARALNATYGHDFARASTAESLVAARVSEVEIGPRTLALKLAKNVAHDRRFEQLPACSLPGGCKMDVRLR